MLMELSADPLSRVEIRHGSILITCTDGICNLQYAWYPELASGIPPVKITGITQWLQPKLLLARHSLNHFYLVGQIIVIQSGTASWTVEN
ncbi:hypothetical protein CDAR_513701 [Caerostris darwini]|uniref:Uncharacterized protein n=1 Tax=Caerostris darwini TaxID=1538125 RepID=A0AAV4R668_9ARAC|nr:hypothetical protein CDAR_513701 [Caerostris darwini]